MIAVIASVPLLSSPLAFSAQKNQPRMKRSHHEARRRHMYGCVRQPSAGAGFWKQKTAPFVSAVHSRRFQKELIEWHKYMFLSSGAIYSSI